MAPTQRQKHGPPRKNLGLRTHPCTHRIMQQKGAHPARKSCASLMGREQLSTPWGSSCLHAQVSLRQLLCPKTHMGTGRRWGRHCELPEGSQSRPSLPRRLRASRARVSVHHPIRALEPGSDTSELDLGLLSHIPHVLRGPGAPVVTRHCPVSRAGPLSILVRYPGAQPHPPPGNEEAWPLSVFSPTPIKMAISSATT